MQVSIPKQHYYGVSKLGRRLVDLCVGKVALSTRRRPSLLTT